MNLLLMIALMIGGPIVGHVLAKRFLARRTEALVFHYFDRALIEEDNAHIAIALGWFVCGLMAAFLMAMPFVAGASS
jgi:hypothetical protein